MSKHLSVSSVRDVRSHSVASQIGLVLWRSSANAALIVIGVLIFIGSVGCQNQARPEDQMSAETDQPALPTNRVDINATVRQNLGITFAAVEKRNISRTLRIPGQFELIPG